MKKETFEAEPMKVLVIGGGGREHALVEKISESPAVSKIFAVSGNAGISQKALCFSLKEDDFPSLINLVKKNRIDLTVVGPEAPLAKGLVDVFQEEKLSIFGPCRKAARLESSKIFAREFMARWGIPTPEFTVASSLSQALKKLEKETYPVALKYDGLAAGKGVRIVSQPQEAISFLHDIFEKNIFSGDEPAVVIEKALSGLEVSCLVVTDGISYLPFAAAHDYKKALDGDKGNNTGGMGAYSPSFLLDEKTGQIIEKEIVQKTLRGLQKEGIDYRGILYFGLMLTEKGPFVLEYNVRFGDPETQVILPRMKNDLVEVMQATLAGRLKEIRLEWKKEKAVCVVLASAGYPGHYQTGEVITGLDRVKDVIVYHAGTRKDNNGNIVTAGGRVLGITGLAADLQQAREKVYLAAETIQFSGKFYRRDIASYPVRK